MTFYVHVRATEGYLFPETSMACLHAGNMRHLYRVCSLEMAVSRSAKVCNSIGRKCVLSGSASWLANVQVSSKQKLWSRKLVYLRPRNWFLDFRVPRSGARNASIPADRNLGVRRPRNSHFNNISRLWTCHRNTWFQ